jgi:uncharacterized membrane-anchored protein YitT (DUF2179 family)
MKKKKMNHQLKEEEDQKTKIDLTIFKSPGIYTREVDITIVPTSPDYKIKKIKKILNRIYK